MRNQKLRRLTLAAIFSALTCAATLLSIPSPLGGYCNLGDCIVLLGAFLMGPLYGAASGGIGSMLADLLLGYAHYAPATLFIKALMALTSALVFYLLGKKRIVSVLLAGLLGEMIMLGGYFLFELPQYGFAGSLASLLQVNLPQAAVGLAAATVLYLVLDKTKLLSKISGGTSHV